MITFNTVYIGEERYSSYDPWIKGFQFSDDSVRVYRVDGDHYTINNIKCTSMHKEAIKTKTLHYENI